MAGPKKPKVERKIYFYRTEAIDEDGEPIGVDIGKVLGNLKALSYGATGRHLEDDEGNATCCWPDRVEAPQWLRVGNVRRTGLPQVEKAGKVRNLKIAAEAGLVESIHVVFFDDGIVGSVFNFYGPRMAKVARYLENKCASLCPRIRFEPLYRTDMLEQLNRFQSIRLLQLRIRAPYAQVVREIDEDLGEAFSAAIRAVGEGQEVELVLKPVGRSRASLGERLLGAVKDLAGRRQDVDRASVSKFTVQGYDSETGSLVLLDLLSDYIISRKSIALLDASSRALRPKSAYLAVEEAYRELRGELRNAAGLPPS